jgi:hypothetical protein
MLFEDKKGGKQKHRREWFAVPYSFSIYVLMNGSTGIPVQLRNGVQQSFVEMQEPVLNIVPQKLYIDAVHIGRLPTLVTIFSLERVAAIFTDFRHALLFFEADKDNRPALKTQRKIRISGRLTKTTATLSSSRNGALSLMWHVLFI